MDVRERLDSILETVRERDPDQTSFQQAITEVLGSLEPALAENPEYLEAGLLERLCEPERQIAFRVPWTDDQGQVWVQRGFRVEFNSALGPFKGGLRFRPDVRIDVVKFLGFEQTFKNALTGESIGGAKGGSDFDPKGRSDGEVMRFCQSFMTELHRHLGADTDVPAGDIGVGPREIGFLFGQYKRLTNRFEAGVITGKGTGWGGSQVRVEATGYGAVIFAREMLASSGRALEGLTTVVSGAGNVALHAADKLHELGATVVACSDSAGYVVDPDGLDLELLHDLKGVRRESLASYPDRRRSARHVTGGSVFEVPCDLALPAAAQNEIDAEVAASLVKNGVLAVVEGANMPTTPEGIEVLREAGVLFAPGKAANAGGVATSALEMAQNAGRARWTFDTVADRLESIMCDVHRRCRDTAEEYGRAGDYVLGANVAGFERIADAMLAQGVV